MASSLVNPSLVSAVGSNILYNLISVFTTSIFYGSYLVLLCWATVVLCRRDGGQCIRAKLVMLSATIIMFLLATFFVASYLAAVVDCICSILVQGVETPLEDKMSEFQARWSKVSIMQTVLFYFQVVIGDAIVVWRAYALWEGNLKAVFLPLILLCASAATSFGYFGCIVENDWPLELPATCNTLNISCYVLSMATNLVSTATIALKVWQHRRSIRQLLGAHSSKTRIQKVLALLLESGLIYLGFLIFQIITFVPSSGTAYAGLITELVTGAISVQFVGIYPTLVIVLVDLRYTSWDQPLEECSNLDFSRNPNLGTSSLFEGGLPPLPILEDALSTPSSSTFTLKQGSVTDSHSTPGNLELEGFCVSAIIQKS